MEVDVGRLGRLGDLGRAQRVAGAGPVVEALGLHEGELLRLRRRQALRSKYRPLGAFGVSPVNRESSDL